MKLAWAVACVSVVLVGCVAGDPMFTAELPAGFFMGLWHGIISFVTLVIGIFYESVQVYEVENTGGWYDFGFLLGVSSIWGSHAGARAWTRRCR
jgi:hypothetical protein